ncbi:MAG: hypothetical protein N4A65_00295 [Cohaesibacter sp.]|nr:hypothetical protein [Cohaesibacter sp.]
MVRAVSVVKAGRGYTTVQYSDGSVVQYNGARNWRNNNPGNIEYGKFAKSKGAIGTDGRFAVFPDYATGRKAKADLIFNGSSYKNKSIAGVISRYAPAFENNTKGYYSAVARAIGVSPNTRVRDLTLEQREIMLDAMERVEGFKVGRAKALKGTVPPTMKGTQPKAPVIEPPLELASLPRAKPAPQLAALPQSRPQLAMAAPLSAMPRGAVEALSLQDVAKIDVPQQVSINRAPSLKGAPLGRVEMGSLPSLEEIQGKRDFDKSFNLDFNPDVVGIERASVSGMGSMRAGTQGRASISAPQGLSAPSMSVRASGAANRAQGVSGMATARNIGGFSAPARSARSVEAKSMESLAGMPELTGGFSAPAVSARQAETQSMQALNSIAPAPVDLVGSSAPMKAKTVNTISITAPKAVEAPKAPMPTVQAPVSMMNPNKPTAVPRASLPNPPNPMAIKAAQGLTKAALTGIGGAIGGLPGALAGRVAGSAVEGAVGDAVGGFLGGGVVGPSGHNYAEGTGIQRGVEEIAAGNPGGFWNYNSDTNQLAQMAYDREKAAMEGRSVKSLGEKISEDFGFGGSSSSSGGGTIICSELYRQGYMPKEIWDADEEWGRMIARRDPDIIRGYRYWAAPVVRLMQRSRRATKLIAWLTRPWAYQMAFEVGAVPKGSALGFCTNAIGIPFSWVIGKALKLHRKRRKNHGSLVMG